MMRKPGGSLALAAAALVVALLAAAIQSRNHERAQDLALIQRRCEMIEAANAQAATLVRAHVWGQPNAPLLPDRRKPAPPPGGLSQ